jgi:hypothetical protein
MEPTEAQLHRARGAYELGRLRSAAREALLLTPLVALALWHCRHVTVTCAASLALMALVAALRWRGGTWGRAVAPALVAGLPAALLPLLGPWLDGARLASLCGWICPAAGLLAGAMLGSWCRRQGDDRGPALVASGAVVLLLGALGCGAFGAADVLGMWLGAAIVAVPVALLHRA